MQSNLGMLATGSRHKIQDGILLSIYTPFKLFLEIVTFREGQNIPPQKPKEIVKLLFFISKLGVFSNHRPD